MQNVTEFVARLRYSFFMYGLCMRLDSVLPRTKIVLLVAAEAHSLLVPAGCTRCGSHW